MTTMTGTGSFSSPLSFTLDREGELLFISTDSAQPETLGFRFSVNRDGKIEGYEMQVAITVSGKEPIDISFTRTSGSADHDISQQSFFQGLLLRLHEAFPNTDFEVIGENWSEEVGAYIRVGRSNEAVQLDHLLQFVRELTQFVLGYLSGTEDVSLTHLVA